MAFQFGSAQSFKQDLVEIARADLVAGRLGRRDFLKLCLWAGGTASFAGLKGVTNSEAAEAKQIIVANYGGQATPAMEEAWGQPYTKDTGVKVIFDGVTPLPGKIKAMVESGKITWDAADADLFVGAQLGAQGVLEPIDYSIVDRSMLPANWATKYAVGNYAYSFVLAYDKTKFPDKPPNYSDFFDIKKYPGKRTLWKYQMGAAEACLFGDGVLADRLYPLDMPRAIKKAKTLGKDLILWSSAAESVQMFVDKEVVMGSIFHPRAAFLERETKGRVTWRWSQGLYCPGAFVVPKGNPAGKEVMRFLNSVLIPERQIKLLSLFGNGPSNPKASAMAPKELNGIDPSFPANLKLQIIRDEDWYGKNYDAAIDQWIDGLSG